ncbi:hypothetical protein CERZMDRAFT_94389 [Cercospora zeae-maydis SCOH1-5]|uniref:SnoaL-like domain-containing protein n=1 Tax=Cercospora zeae-maydis SCOH1-5 TaxID=717836 RepID=A0A6A6FR85_9PEZI|nr:hypothetical protein CERZMDRAFT_94389 [Cercospora zeae-maydis SCOH1-5]
MDSRRDADLPAAAVPPSAQHTQQDRKNPTAKGICERFYIGIQVLNDHDFDHKTENGQLVRSYVSPTFTARFENIGEEMNWIELTHVWREWHQQYPEMRFEVSHCSCDVDVGRGVAQLYAEMTVSVDRGVELGSLVKACHRRRKDGKWMYESFHGLRGMKQNGGFV